MNEYALHPFSGGCWVGEIWAIAETFYTYLAQRTQWVCRYKEYKKRWRCIFHTLMDLSSEAVTRNWPSAEKFTLRTGPVCALNSEDFPLLEMNSLILITYLT